MFVSRGANNIQLDSHPRRARLPPTQTHPLDAELGAAPVATLGVVTDGVTGAHADPLGDGAVLLLLLPQDLLGLEGLLGRLLAKGEDGAKVRKPRLGMGKKTPDPNTRRGTDGRASGDARRRDRATATPFRAVVSTKRPSTRRHTRSGCAAAAPRRLPGGKPRGEREHPALRPRGVDARRCRAARRVDARIATRASTRLRVSRRGAGNAPS